MPNTCPKNFILEASTGNIPAHYHHHVLSFGRWTVDLMVLAKRALFIIYQRTMSFIRKNYLFGTLLGWLSRKCTILMMKVSDFFESWMAVTDA